MTLFNLTDSRTLDDRQPCRLVTREMFPMSSVFFFVHGVIFSGEIFTDSRHSFQRAQSVKLCA